MAMMKDDKIKTFCPSSAQEWRSWLEKNHESENAVWLIFYKKSSGKPTLTWSEAVDQALCFGWIDSVKKSIDSERFKQYFSKRKAKSTWSKVNKEKVDHLISTGQMRDAGLAIIEIARQNGSWTILDEVEALILPEDLAMEFEKYPGALDFYENLSKSMKRGVLYWIISAKRTETRQKRIAEIAENAGNNQLPKRFI